MRTFVLFTTTLACIVASVVGSAVFQSGAYDNVVVAIKDSVSSENCKTIISNIEVSLKIHYIIRVYNLINKLKLNSSAAVVGEIRYLP